MLLTIPGAALLVPGCVTYPDAPSCPRQKKVLCDVPSTQAPARDLPQHQPLVSFSLKEFRITQLRFFFSLSTFLNLKSVFSAAYRHLQFKLLQSFQTQYFQNKIYHFYLEILSIQCLCPLKGSAAATLSLMEMAGVILVLSLHFLYSFSHPLTFFPKRSLLALLPSSFPLCTPLSPME